MFPFKTKSFSFIVDNNIADVKNRLLKKIKRKRFLKWYPDYEWVGNFKDDHYVVEQAQFWERNSFRPIIIFSVEENGIHTLVKGYYRLDFIVTACPFILFGSGIWIAVEARSIMPLIATAFLAVMILMLFIYPLFLRSYRKAEKEFKALVTQTFH